MPIFFTKKSCNRGGGITPQMPLTVKALFVLCFCATSINFYMLNLFFHIVRTDSQMYSFDINFEFKLKQSQFFRIIRANWILKKFQFAYGKQCNRKQVLANPYSYLKGTKPFTCLIVSKMKWHSIHLTCPFIENFYRRCEALLCAWVFEVLCVFLCCKC